ncbi:hypothetical protein C0J52_26207, partial [Blattella germanica]
LYRGNRLHLRQPQNTLDLLLHFRHFTCRYVLTRGHDAVKTKQKKTSRDYLSNGATWPRVFKLLSEILKFYFGYLSSGHRVFACSQNGKVGQ